jgi:ABC-type dipeptide/oligopeptide/nickel transport system ATPase component
MTHTIIGLSGKKRSGKSTAADTIMDLMQGDSVRISLATPIKIDIQGLMGVPIDDKNKEIIRPVLQSYGEAMKQLFGSDYWVKRADHTWRQYSPFTTVMVCDDVRFPLEAEWIRSLGGIVVKINRPGFDDSSDHHVSETAIDSIKPDYIIDNDSTQQQLKTNIVNMLKYATNLRVTG